MKKSQNELSLLRKPSASEIAKKDAEAKHLKQQMGAWSALVEFRPSWVPSVGTHGLQCGPMGPNGFMRFRGSS